MRMIKGQRAQTAVEIAVFGAILIFALGAIIRSGVSRGNQQSAMLKATRLALTMSYDTSKTMRTASRNFSSVLIVEDRLAVGSDKYGPIDRSPSLMQGSGTHSANLYMSTDFGDVEDLPLFDIFVNGKHIALTTAAFKTIDLFPGEGGCGSQCRSRIWTDKPPGNTQEATSARYREVCTPCPETESECIKKIQVLPCAETGTKTGTGKTAKYTCDPATTCSNCSSTSRETYTIEDDEPAGCAKLYRIVDNHPGISEWCNGDDILCTTDAMPACSDKTAEDLTGCNLSVEERFDLDHDGDSDVPSNQRKRFSWQWYLVMGFDESKPLSPFGIKDKSVAGGAPEPSTIYRSSMGEGINEGERDDESPKNMAVDVDQDLQMEIIKKIYTNQSRAITSMDVRDGQDGDMNTTFSDRDRAKDPNVVPPGFMRDVNIFTTVKEKGADGEGTYLEIDEGKLFSAEGRYVRTTSKKDVVDIIERVFKLSNDTGRLCLDGDPQPKIKGDPSSGTWVEACDNCHLGDNRWLTCMETDPKVLLLFIRSRVADYHGHKWVTDLNQ